MEERPQKRVHEITETPIPAPLPTTTQWDLEYLNVSGSGNSLHWPGKELRSAVSMGKNEKFDVGDMF